MKKSFSPSETASNFIEIGYTKATLSIYKLIILGVLAGAFIAFAAQGSSFAIHTIESVGLAKTLSGAVFATGLMMVVIAGGELFTGNSLIAISCLSGRSRWTGLLRNWLFVYIGNFIGSVLIAWLIYISSQLNATGGALGGFTIKTAVYKTSLSFSSAFALGVLCNWLVCLAVWMSAAAKDIAGKILAIFFPIWLFIISGFEHSIANMYYIPAGILAKSNSLYVEAATNMGVTADQLDMLNVGTMLTQNLIPVTIGNIVGGVLFVAVCYYLVYIHKDKTKIVD